MLVTTYFSKTLILVSISTKYAFAARKLTHQLQSTANEGPLLTLRDIATDKDFANYIHTLLPLLDEGLRKRVLQVYAPLSPQEFTAPFSTTGTSPPTALEVSDFAVGPQQRAFVSQYPARNF